MEKLEVHYGKAVAQFTVRTLLAYVQTPPRELQINVEVFLSL
jgi:hypothetical protein